MMHSSRDAVDACAILTAAVIGAGMPHFDLAAAETVTAGVADDFRAALATSQDIAEGKRLAAASCARCHGPDGISTAKGVPHLAGQRAVYLHLELQAYKSGTRGKGMMADAVRFLSEDALIKVAAWYSTLDPAQPPPATTAAIAVSEPDQGDAGKGIAASCAGCHGEAGISRIPGMPSLAGLDPRYLHAAIDAYKSGQRRHDMMEALVAGLSDADITRISNFYSAQNPGRAQTPAPGNKEAGKAAAAACVACHGLDGYSTGMTPSLAGQDAQYFVTAMRAYKNGSRASPVMKSPANAAGEATLNHLAAFYASLPPRPPKLTRLFSTADWAERCDRCHGVNGNSTDPRVPALAAQRTEYLESTLNAYRTGARESTAMSAMSKVLSESDVELLAAHYSRQKARAVVYVMLPVNR